MYFYVSYESLFTFSLCAMYKHVYAHSISNKCMLEKQLKFIIKLINSNFTHCHRYTCYVQNTSDFNKYCRYI